MDRYTFLQRSLCASTALLAAPLMHRAIGAPHEQNIAEPVVHPFPTPGPSDLGLEQIKLPYAYEALEPYIDRQTMEIHYTKHHRKYVAEVKAALDAEPVKATNAEELFAGVSVCSPKLRNNAGGAWNHNFFWQVMKPGVSVMNARVKDALVGSFSSVEAFKEKFSSSAKERFGSGWAWLVKTPEGRLEYGSTPNQDNPLMDVSDLRGTPLLCLDIWEHAYYLKYQNKRDEYITQWWNTVNWDEVARRLG